MSDKLDELHGEFKRTFETLPRPAGREGLAHSALQLAAATLAAIPKATGTPEEIRQAYDTALPLVDQAAGRFGRSHPLVKILVKMGAIARARRDGLPDPTDAELDKLTASRCFIAAAACGSEDAAEVEMLRRWRDDVLLTTWTGGRIVAVYERVSPPLARLVERNGWLRLLVKRTLIAPAAARFGRRPPTTEV